VQKTFRESIQALPGAVDLIRSIADAGVPMAICSGALREEIVLASRTVGVLDRFGAIVAAEEVDCGKPDPEGYLLARTRLAEKHGRDIRAESCAVVEDSPAGIQAGRDAGMKVLAVATSYGREHLTEAHRIVDSLTEVTAGDLEELL